MSGFYMYQEDEDKNVLQQITGWAIDILAVVGLAIFLVTCLGNVRTVSGQSMEPTLSADDRVLLDDHLFKALGLERYDIVQFTLENDEEQVNLKRIVGLPGETIQIRDGHLVVNGEVQPVYEPLGEISIPGIAAEEITLGSDEYFLIGDNTNGSADSRSEDIGPIAYQDICGCVWFRITPWDKIGPVS